MKRLLPILLLLATIRIAFAQNDHVGSGRAILFDGVDDYIDLGNIYDFVQLPITISAWVYVEPSDDVIQYPIFVSQDDNDATYNGFTFVCSTLPHIGFTVGDGQGSNNPAFRRSRAGYFNTLGRWVYLTAVAVSETEMYTYLNGHDVSGDYQGSSSLTMDSNSPGEVAKIGYYVGNNNLLYRFKGMIDELRIWNRALSEQEIRESMCRRLKGDEANLIGYWNFDETSGDQLKDLSANGFDGTLKGNPTRVYSGAPVGDESVFLYSASWSGKTLLKDDLIVSNVSGNPYGVHIYNVNKTPSQTGGLNVASLQLPYYGIFLADDGQHNSFDLSFLENNVCRYMERKDNSIPLWEQSEILSGIYHRLEIIPSFEETGLHVNLGNNLTLCDQSSHSLETGTDATGKTFLWNTGETTPLITVTSSGAFSVEVKEGCKVDRDTIQVSFLQKPSSFSFGPDEVLCSVEPRKLTVDVEDTGLSYIWQNGSTETFLVADEFGTYWLRLENACGYSMDSITFTQKVEPELDITFGPDIVVCDKPSFTLQPFVSHPSGKTFLWNTGAISESISVNVTGSYWIKVAGECKIGADTITVTFLNTPPAFSVGEDEQLCAVSSRVLSPDLEHENFDYSWHDGSTEKFFLADQFGTYWLKISNACGSSVDSVTFTQKLVQGTPRFNFISPDNQDNLNQFFILDQPLVGAQLHVFNRWGKKVFESLSYQNNWDGRGLPAGVYFYTINGECIERRKGSVTIMR